MILLILVIFLSISTRKFIESIKFSTKSAYPKYVYYPKKIFPTSFQIVHARYLSRHGSRYPSNNDMSKFRALLAKLANHSKEYTNYIDKSRICLNESIEKELSELGKSEMFSIGKHYRERLSNLFSDESYTPTNMIIESTCLNRAFDSMSYFMDGMFENVPSLGRPIKHRIPCENDSYLRFFSTCNYYKQLQKCLERGAHEKEEFVKTEEVQALIQRINKLFKMEDGYGLDGKDLEALFLICAYDILINKGTMNTHTCRLFVNDDILIANYLMDIKQFYKKANSELINIQMACRLFNSMYNSIVEAFDQCSLVSSKQHNVSGHFSFAHAETLIPILGSFGYFGGNDDNIETDNLKFLSASNFESLKEKRPFLGSFFSPMGGNIMFVVGCDTNHNDEPHVTSLLNEKYIKIPCCNHSLLFENSNIPVCTKKEFISCFETLTQKCHDNKCDEKYPCHKVEG